MIGQFLKQFYTEAATIPPQVMLPQEIEEANIIKQWLKTQRNCEKVELMVPRRGQSADLVKMAAENATETLSALRARWQADTNKQSQALSELQQALGLERPLNKIECYDVSNIQGTASVGSMVVFELGVPSKKNYRHFNIKTVVGPDDFASMEEMLSRRFKRWKLNEEDDTPGKKVDEAFSILPDLLIVDGGKGQLGRATRILQEFGLLQQVQVVGLAKQMEELFQPGKSKSVLLPRHSQALYLVQRIRDEAHRFGITTHRNKRTKIGMTSQLDAIAGVGPTRRKALLRHFASIEEIRHASLEQLTAVKGITLAVAKNIKSQLE